MLGKMLKYDLKAMSKTMLPFFLVIIGMTVLNSFFIHFEWMTGIIAGSSIIFVLPMRSEVPFLLPLKSHTIYLHCDMQETFL